MNKISPLIKVEFPGSNQFSKVHQMAPKRLTVSFLGILLDSNLNVFQEACEVKLS